jgi:hypothetical protein
MKYFTRYVLYLIYIQWIYKVYENNAEQKIISYVLLFPQ